jgi:hypothetical protein
MTSKGGRTQLANPYSTGGGGTVLEHRYGAVLLAHLLLGDPVSELGDDVAPVSVRFQDSAFSPVDDLVVVGRTSDGAQRQVSIGVRRAPKFTTSDEPTAVLLVSYLLVVPDHWDRVRAGTWRLALAVTSPNPAAHQVRELAVIARDKPSETAFRDVVAQQDRTKQAVRDRLAHFDALIKTAATEAEIDLTHVNAGELTWRVLHSLRLSELRLEGVDEADRTFAITRLRTIVPGADLADANTLFERLEKLSDRYAPSSATVTEALLRQHLSGIQLDRSPSYPSAWQVLDSLADSVEHGVCFRLADADTDLELDRTEIRDALVTEMMRAGSRASALVVTGEPDVGKSALTLRATHQLAATGAAVTVLNLRDIPMSLVEFEALLATRLVTALGSTAVNKTRLLVIDGAESVLEGRGQLLFDVARAAMTAGLGVVAVTRTDGAGAVTDGLQRACQGVDRTGGDPQEAVREHEVPRLTSAEIERLAAAFPRLSRWAGDPRAVWLLGRPGLVDMLMRAGPFATMPEGTSSEADLFAVVWRHLVRRGESVLPGGPSPDARDHSLTALARRQLLPHHSESPDASALPSLRSDGLLRPPGPVSAWSPLDRFASDLVRDMSVARLLITDGFSLLNAAEAPRWTLRAVRVACQAYLLGAPEDRNSFGHLRSVFTDLAEHHGQRWGELPWEALLTLGSARGALTRAWPDLLTEQHSGLRTVLRLAKQRYTKLQFGDSVILGPLVELAFCSDLEMAPDDHHTTRSIGESIRDLVLAWLRGLIETSTGPIPLRQRVRHRILASDPVLWDKFAVEALSLLGPDLDGPAEAFLTRLVDDGGSRLAPVVEHLGPVLMMTKHQPQFLLALAESYYIERQDDETSLYGWLGRHSLDEGIRHHRNRGGITARMAAWQYGPFWQLLCATPRDALGLINRILDHAAVIRVGEHEGLQDQSVGELPGLDLDLPGVGVRRCVGDGAVWGWYRGSTVGPYPCISALLAVERYADQLVAVAGISVDRVVELLLRDCHNLAMPGLVVGFLVRHLEQAGDLLDRWFSEPHIWQLEFARIASEGVLHVQGPDPVDLVGRNRRRHSLRDAAAEMTVRVMLVGDQGRLDALAAAGDELLRRAQELIADAGDDEGAHHFLISVEGWAAGFRPENYQTEPDHDGNVVVQYEHPEHIAASLASGAARVSRVSEALRLQNIYGRSEDRVAPVETLLADLVLARDFANDPPNAGLDPRDPIAAVAAAAAVAHVEGRIQLPQQDLRWATGILVDAINSPHPSEYTASSFYSLGADRSAAVGLPALLASISEQVQLDRQGIASALHQSATHHFDEVRIAFALALKRVWDTSCDAGLSPGACRHQVAWVAVQEGLRDCRLGDWDFPTQTRTVDPLNGPYNETLPLVHTEQLYLKRLMPPLAATAAAARSTCCIATDAKRLLVVLFDAHRRATDHSARKGYENRQGGHAARVLVDTTAGGDAQPLIDYVRLFTSNARALTDLLHDVAELFTYNDIARPSLPTVWRVVMTTTLDALDTGADLQAEQHWSDFAIGALLPAPRLNSGDLDPDAILDHARNNWLTPDSIADLVIRWIPYALREPKALDALAQFSACAPTRWQADTGLVWAEQLIDGSYSSVASRSWFLTNWLETLRTSRELTPDQTARWCRLIDGLAAEGDHRAADLQQIEE